MSVDFKSKLLGFDVENSIAQIKQLSQQLMTKDSSSEPTPSAQDPVDDIFTSMNTTRDSRTNYSHFDDYLNSMRDQVKPSSTTSVNKPLGPLLEGTTSPTQFSTFNTAGFYDVDVTSELDKLFATSDVIGTQEQDETELANTIKRHSQTHGVIVGSQNGSNPPEYSPIFYDKEKFDVVHIDSLDMPGLPHEITPK